MQPGYLLMTCAPPRYKQINSRTRRCKRVQQTRNTECLRCCTLHSHTHTHTRTGRISTGPWKERVNYTTWTAIHHYSFHSIELPPKKNYSWRSCDHQLWISVSSLPNKRRGHYFSSSSTSEESVSNDRSLVFCKSTLHVCLYSCGQVDEPNQTWAGCLVTADILSSFHYRGFLTITAKSYLFEHHRQMAQTTFMPVKPTTQSTLCFIKSGSEHMSITFKKS